MCYTKNKDEIIIENTKDFNIEHILECGQIFTYKKLNNLDYLVFSKDKMAHIFFDKNKYIIKTKNVDYFWNFFDLNTDYSKIKQKLKTNKFMENAINFGYGIRILKQDLLEVIIGFVISANNNITRIKNSMEKIRSCGKNMGDYFAFPTLEELGEITYEKFRDFGCGYRVNYLVKLLGQLKEVDLNDTKTWDTVKLKKWLLSLCGVGQKVADCIMLFGYNRVDCFPVDTWIEKVYVDIFHCKKTREKMSKDLVDYFGNLSGIAQQYLFYYKRTLG